MRRLQVHKQRDQTTSQVEKDLLGLCSDRFAARSQPRHRDSSTHGAEHSQPDDGHVRAGTEAHPGTHGEGLVPSLPRVRPLQEPARVGLSAPLEQLTIEQRRRHRHRCHYQSEQHKRQRQRQHNDHDDQPLKY